MQECMYEYNGDEIKHIFAGYFHRKNLDQMLKKDDANSCAHKCIHVTYQDTRFLRKSNNEIV